MSIVKRSNDADRSGRLYSGRAGMAGPRSRIASLLLVAGLSYVICAAAYLAITGGGAWSAGPFTIRILTLHIPLKIFWYLLLISLILFISDTGTFSLRNIRIKYDEYYLSVKSDLFPQNPRKLGVILFLLFVTAFAVRIYKIDIPPLDFHPTRQYKNAIIARHLYYKTLKEDQGRKDFYDMKYVFTEPPLIELASVLFYHLAGRECLFIPRVLSSILWLAGGVALYSALSRISSQRSALIGTIFFLFDPFAIKSSRCFMPDPLMVSLLLFYVLALVNFIETPSRSRFYFAALIGSLAVFAKVSSGFFIVASSGLLFFFWKEGRRRLSIFDLIAFDAIILIPLVIYTKFFLRLTMGGSLLGWLFLPSLLLKPETYLQRLHLIDSVVWLILFIAGIAGILLYRGAPRILLMGLGAGYLLFCLIFNYHTATHDYYHMPLIPIVAMGLGKLGDFMIYLLGDRFSHSRYALLTGFMVILVAFSMDGASRIKESWAREQVRSYENVGNIVGHSRDTFILAPYYGSPLKYHGWIEGFAWPNQSDQRYMYLERADIGSPETYFDSEFKRSRPDFFIISSLDELEKQPGLGKLLEKRFPLAARGGTYVIYDLRNEKGFPKEGKCQGVEASSITGGLQTRQGR